MSHVLCWEHRVCKIEAKRCLGVESGSRDKGTISKHKTKCQSFLKALKAVCLPPGKPQNLPGDPNRLTAPSYANLQSAKHYMLFWEGCSPDTSI